MAIETFKEMIMREVAPLLFFALVLAACAASPRTVVSEPVIVQESYVVGGKAQQLNPAAQRANLERLNHINDELKLIQQKILELRGGYDSVPYP